MSETVERLDPEIMAAIDAYGVACVRGSKRDPMSARKAKLVQLIASRLRAAPEVAEPKILTESLDALLDDFGHNYDNAGSISDAAREKVHAFVRGIIAAAPLDVKPETFLRDHDFSLASDLARAAVAVGLDVEGGVFKAEEAGRYRALAQRLHEHALNALAPPDRG